MAQFMLYLPLAFKPEEVAEIAIKRLGWNTEIEVQPHHSNNSRLGYSVGFKLEKEDINFGIIQINFRDFIDELADILGVEKPDGEWAEILFVPNHIKNDNSTDVFIFQFVGVMLDIFTCDLMLVEQNMNMLLLARKNGRVTLFDLYNF